MTENFSFDDLKERYKNSKIFKIISISVSVLLVGVLGYLGYRQFIWKPDNEKSKEAYVPALNVIVQEQNNPQSDAKVSSIDPIKKLQGTV